jgi:hypothetical protein
MSRYEKRKADRQAASIVKNAKTDMIKWVETLDHIPSDTEAKAWQDGYLSGINRVRQTPEVSE